MLKPVELINAKGNHAPKVSAAIKDQVISNLKLGDRSFEQNARGELFLEIATDAGTGAPIYAKVDLSISTLDLPNRVKPVAKATEKAEVTPVVVEDLFD